MDLMSNKHMRVPYDSNGPGTETAVSLTQGRACQSVTWAQRGRALIALCPI